MKKRVNDIFYSLQGEGHNSGRAAVFIRFAGCNLKCSFCDTEFNSYREMTDDEIVAAIKVFPARFVVLTGGEPTLQVDDAFVELLHQNGFEVAMESNGTRPAPRNLDWLTVSPKDSGGWLKVDGGRTIDNSNEKMPDEIKVVYGTNLLPPTSYHLPPKTLLYLQPCDTGDEAQNKDNVRMCIEYIKEYPEWRLSLQTHKLVGFK